MGEKMADNLEPEPALYGISNSNRQNNELWGKNQFNSTFPVSLACYMRDNKKTAVYLHLDKNLKVIAQEISFDKVFGTEIPNEDLYFAFESKFEPYSVYSHDDIGNIDLVVKTKSNDFLMPLEVKLTVLPDSGTSTKPESQWGSEIVIRPATTKYCALGIANSCKNEFDDLRKRFEPIGVKIQEWSNEVEILTHIGRMLDVIDKFQINYLTCQKPFLMQPVWKTQGQTPILAEHAFDIFIWSDFALSRLFLDNAQACKNSKSINRQMRSAARFFRFMYHLSTTGKVPLARVYTQMTFGLQTDKEFAVNGSVTNRYMKSPRLLNPAIHKDSVAEIILNGGEKNLKPERRFDQTLYFTVANQNAEKN
jgi:hypothetical protein